MGGPRSRAAQPTNTWIWIVLPQTGVTLVQEFLPDREVRALNVACYFGQRPSDDRHDGAADDDRGDEALCGSELQKRPKETTAPIRSGLRHAGPVTPPPGAHGSCKNVMANT